MSDSFIPAQRPEHTPSPAGASFDPSQASEPTQTSENTAAGDGCVARLVGCSSLSEKERLLRYTHDVGWWLCQGMKAVGVEAVIEAIDEGIILRFSGISLGLTIDGGLDDPGLGCAAFVADLDGRIKSPDLGLLKDQQSAPLDTKHGGGTDHIRVARPFSVQSDYLERRNRIHVVGTV